MTNQEHNSNLQDIGLMFAGGDPNNPNFSSSAKEHVTALTAKGITIAETDEQWKEMNMRVYGSHYEY